MKTVMTPKGFSIALFCAAFFLFYLVSQTAKADLQTIAVNHAEINQVESDFSSLKNRVDSIIAAHIKQNLAGNIFKHDQTAFFYNDIAIRENKEGYTYIVSIPSEQLKKVAVLIKNNTVVVGAPGKNTQRIISGNSAFTRIIPIPGDADITSITPVSENGVLTISFKKI